MRQLASSLVAALLTLAAAHAAAAPLVSRQPLTHSGYDAFFSGAAAEKAAVTRNAKASASRATLAARQGASVRGYTAQVDKDLGAATFVWADATERALAPTQSSLAQRNLAKQTGATADARARDFLKRNSRSLRVTRDGVESAELIDLHDTGRGPVIARYQQQVNGLEVFNRQISVVMDRQLRPVAASGYFASAARAAGAARNAAGAAAAPGDAVIGSFSAMTAAQAIARGFAELGGTIAVTSLREQTREGRFQRFDVSVRGNGKLKLTGSQHARRVDRKSVV